MPLNVFKASVIEGQQLAIPAEEGHLDELFAMEATPLAATWSRPPVTLVLEREDGQPRSPTDFPFLGDHALVLKGRAYSSLEPHLAALGELLPLTCETEPLWLFNSLVVTPALDLERSEVEISKFGQVLFVDRYVFRPEPLQGALLFRIPEMTTLYMSDDFVSLVDSLGLEGFGREQVWSG